MNFKRIVPYAVAILVFAIVSLIYFSPVLEGKKIQQSDITQFIGSSKEIVDFRKQHGEEPYWTNTSFGGMPSYAVSTYYPNDYIKKLDKILRFLPRPADYLFLYFLGFFILLLTLKVNWKLAILGSLGFGLSTYLIIILGVGHNAKAHAIAYMPMVLSGILLVFQRKYLLGFVVTVLAMSLELSASHIQMTYYLGFIVLILGIVQLLESLREKQLKDFLKSMSVLLVAVLLALGTNATGLMATQEYAKHSTRSQSELTITPDGKEKVPTSGLSHEYITEYSYGKLETFNLFIPRFMGGTSHEKVENSELQFFLQSAVNKGLSSNDANYLMQISSMYWGNQPIVAAPAYIGAVFIFLFVLALFLVKGKLKYWLVAATIFSIMMSWGKNLEGLTNFFIDYFPLYNKFRAVSSIQVIAELCIPLLGILGLKQLFSTEVSKESKLKGLKNATIIVGGLGLIFVMFGTSLFDFVTQIDEQIDSQVEGYLEAIVADRQTLFYNDSIRSLGLVLGIATLIWLFLKEKINQTVAIGGFAVLVLIDLVNVDKRYVNDDNFVSARTVSRPFKATNVDKEILKDKGHYRVANFTKNLFADGSTSYFHKSIGGYHAAKPRRYQELYDFHINKNNLQVLNMLNVKYLIGSNDKGQEVLEKNEDANGNAWFIKNLKHVSSANEEIKMLDSLDTKKTAAINEFSSNLELDYILDSLSTITLTHYQANAISYESRTSSMQFAVFSEIYYKDGWNAYIDGEPSEIYRVNYVLRGLEVPSGKHTIEFKFEPTVINKGNTITLVSYTLFILISIGWIVYEKRKKKNESPQ